MRVLHTSRTWHSGLWARSCAHPSLPPSEGRLLLHTRPTANPLCEALILFWVPMTQHALHPDFRAYVIGQYDDGVLMEGPCSSSQTEW